MTNPFAVMPFHAAVP